MRGLASMVSGGGVGVLTGSSAGGVGSRGSPEADQSVRGQRA
jgi:hypothetical protein